MEERKCFFASHTVTFYSFKNTICCKTIRFSLRFLPRALPDTSFIAMNLKLWWPAEKVFSSPCTYCGFWEPVGLNPLKAKGLEVSVVMVKETVLYSPIRPLTDICHLNNLLQTFLETQPPPRWEHQNWYFILEREGQSGFKSQVALIGLWQGTNL